MRKVRERSDPALEKTRGTFGRIPYFLLHRALRLISFLTLTLNLDLRWAGIPRDPFGSLMITNIGSLGLDLGWVPLVPYARVPILLATGAVKERPIAEDGKVVIARMMNVNASSITGSSTATTPRSWPGSSAAGWRTRSSTSTISGRSGRRRRLRRLRPGRPADRRVPDESAACCAT